MSFITMMSDKELPKPIDVGVKIDDVSVITLKSDRELPKPTYADAKIDDVSVVTSRNHQERYDYLGGYH